MRRGMFKAGDAGFLHLGENPAPAREMGDQQIEMRRVAEASDLLGANFRDLSQDVCGISSGFEGIAQPNLIGREAKRLGEDFRGLDSANVRA